ncbi:MAG: NIPSNAP family protein, partial [Pseudomonadota bacterium]
MVYLIAYLKVVSGKNEEFLDILQNEYIPIIVNRYGWKLIACWQTQVGDLDQVIDIWGFDDFNQFWASREAMYKDPEYKEARKKVRSLLHEERVEFV